MSPPPLPYVVETLRVQAPLTLSDTVTWRDVCYWPSQPTSRSPAVTGLVSVIVRLLAWPPLEFTPPWSHFALGGGAPGVVTCSAGEDWAEWLPAVSKASTV